MIFPFLTGLLPFVRAPITYFFFAMNLFVFLGTYEPFVKADKELDTLLDDQAFLEVQGTLFASMIEKEPKGFSETLRSLAKDSLERDTRQMLGTLALRNSAFMSRAEKYPFHGDAVAIESWRLKFKKLNEAQNKHPSYAWGLSDAKSAWTQYLSYQFAHSGFAHLFWNMVFLLLFGCAVERRFGSSFVALTYVGSGFVGAAAFVAMSGLSSSPLVGASAAVSGLMALVAMGSWLNKERLRYFFMLLPMRPYFGFAYLPAWLVLVVYSLPDVSGYLGSSSEFGSVAYSAHLGGATFGAAIAYAFYRGWLVRDEEDDSDLDDEHKEPRRAEAKDDRAA